MRAAPVKSALVLLAWATGASTFDPTPPRRITRVSRTSTWVASPLNGVGLTSKKGGASSGKVPGSTFNAMDTAYKTALEKSIKVRRARTKCPGGDGGRSDERRRTTTSDGDHQRVCLAIVARFELAHDEDGERDVSEFARTIVSLQRLPPVFRA